MTKSNKSARDSGAAQTVKSLQTLARLIARNGETPGERKEARFWLRFLQMGILQP